MLLQGRARRSDCDARGVVQRVAVEPARDRWERDALVAVLCGELDGAAVARSEQIALAVPAAAPDRADRVDHMPHREPARAGDLRVAGLAAAEPAVLVEQLRPGGPMDRAVDAAAAEERRVRGVDD